MKNRRHKRRLLGGFNLVEAAIVLGVVGLVIGGIWTAAASVQENKRRSDFYAGMIHMVSSTRHLFARNMPSNTDVFITTDQARDMKLVPENMQTAASATGYSGIDPWGHGFAIMVRRDGLIAATPRPTVEILTFLNTGACLHLVGLLLAASTDTSDFNRVIDQDMSLPVLGSATSITFPQFCANPDGQNVLFQFQLLGG